MDPLYKPEDAHLYALRIQQAALNLKHAELTGRREGKPRLNLITEYLNEIDGCSAALREIFAKPEPVCDYCGGTDCGLADTDIPHNIDGDPTE